jgi:DNA-binding protein Fis
LTYSSLFNLRKGVLYQNQSEQAFSGGTPNMGAERVGAIASAIEPDVESREHPDSRAHGSFTAVPPTQLKIAERPGRGRVHRLLALADTILKETESLVRDQAFTDESNRLQALNVAEGIDFYSEVERFESGLIRLALDQTRGHQARAAKLLHIKPTTLNSKIKLYGIEY